ncbi:S26 family signal peptidase [Planococcus dechangensis]|uniref:S26 family signal peptidase n=1 Tax=Planococcus dechangensis TaxID=1176255 RepID=A0ABV9M8F6_9BACL
MNKFKRELDSFVGDEPRFKKSLRRRILLRIKDENKPRTYASKWLPVFKYTAIFMLLLTVVTTFLIVILNENGREIPNSAPASPESSIMTDSKTVAEIEIFTSYEEPLEVLDFKYDAMDRGNHEYAAYPLLIDPLAYDGNDVSRGDVIVYEAEFFDGKQRTIGRVIGLPNEQVGIVEGQIYINDQQLDTFYGRAHRAGINSNEEYNQAMTKNGAPQNIDSMKEVFFQNTDDFRLAENEIFVLGDDWFRGSQQTLTTSEVQGKVIGYFKK